MDDITIPHDISPESMKLHCLWIAQQIGMQHGWKHDRILSVAHLFHEWVDPCGVERKPS